jgi:hypothetical protein
MKSAPSVSYPVGRFCLERPVALGAVALFSLVWMVLLWQALTRLWAGDASGNMMVAPTVFLGALGAVFFVWMLRREQRVPDGELAWTQNEGEALWEWTHGQACKVVQPRVRLDLGSAVWMSCLGHDGRTVWIWAHAAKDPSQWRPFRRALHAAG